MSAHKRMTEHTITSCILAVTQLFMFLELVTDSEKWVSCQNSPVIPIQFRQSWFKHVKVDKYWFQFILSDLADTFDVCNAHNEHVILLKFLRHLSQSRYTKRLKQIKLNHIKINFRYHKLFSEVYNREIEKINEKIFQF